MEKEGNSQSHSSASRLTDSRVACDWSLQDSMILVKEVGTVEVECKGKLSSSDKWVIVAQNCNSVMDNRTLGQVRRRWFSLLVDYDKIKNHQEKNSTSYWSMIDEKRVESGLPESFDLDLFTQISQVKQIVEDRADIDHDFESGSKKQRVNPQPAKELSPKETKQVLMAKLREKAELINRIVKGTGSSRLKTRRDGDELISSLGDLTEELNKLRELILVGRK
ncbi:uncharacterized protein LOC124943010 [Impatiens glandulifera]|uniref:uncharacterized protein LOC124943010 n=1 Tax=Impatiens glandulifera TaxID=253017 RepID=UPI001FB1521B|nr:uncharacterized protein LOC124943010 [Impatiens glandulifera]